jgi:hypothetical protein
MPPFIYAPGNLNYPTAPAIDMVIFDPCRSTGEVIWQDDR